MYAMSRDSFPTPLGRHWALSAQRVDYLQYVDHHWQVSDTDKDLHIM
jgi:hypothetical protein